MTCGTLGYYYKLPIQEPNTQYILLDSSIASLRLYLEYVLIVNSFQLETKLLVKQDNTGRAVSTMVGRVPHRTESGRISRAITYFKSSTVVSVSTLFKYFI